MTGTGGALREHLVDRIKMAMTVCEEVEMWLQGGIDKIDKRGRL